MDIGSSYQKFHGKGSGLDVDPHHDHGGCQCAGACCCGKNVKVSVPKNILGYENSCIRFCRPGHNDQKGQFDVSVDGLEQDQALIAAVINADPGCTNSLLAVDVSLNAEFSLECFFDRVVQIEEFSGVIPNGENSLFTIDASDCPGTTFELDAQFSYTSVTDYCEPGVYVLDIADVNSASVFDESTLLPVSVVTDPRCSTSMLEMDVDIMVSISL